MRFILLAILFSVFLSSCTGEKVVTNNYLYNVKDRAARFAINMPEPVIQKNDLLYIRVFSQSIDRTLKIDEPYNLPEQSTTSSGSNSISPSAGFLVDNNGDIEYPQIGRVHAAGLTKEGLANEIKNKLNTLGKGGQAVLTNPSVIVRFLNYKVTVLGEVQTPGEFTAPTDRVTILDALGMAGDITEFGNRSNIKVLRHHEDGQVELGQVDLTTKDFFASPYFRLQQNDVVMVEQTGRRIKQQEQQTVAQQISIASGVITAIALILNFLR